MKTDAPLRHGTALGEAIHGREHMELTVIVPAFNEGGRILANLREIAITLASFSTSWEIILVDDGSRDETYTEAVKAQAYIPELRVLSYPTNRGKGFALRHGASVAQGELVVFLDADLELHPKQVPGLLQVLDREGADLVVGSKRYKDAGYAFPLLRRILSHSYSSLVHLLFHLPVRDTQVGLKLFRGQVLRDALPEVRCTRFAFDLDLLVQAQRMRYRLAKAPVTVRFLRTSSRLTLRDMVGIWADTLRIYYRVRVPQRPDLVDDRNARTPTEVDPKI